MNMEQLIIPENLMLISVLLLALIALLLIILIGLVRKQISLLSDLKSAQPTPANQLASVTSDSVPEEEVAVITAVITQMLPGVKIGAIQISPVSK